MTFKFLGAYWFRFRALRKIASRGWRLASLKICQGYSTAKNNVDMAPSLAEADAILAKFGWAEEAAVAA